MKSKKKFLNKIENDKIISVNLATLSLLLKFKKLNASRLKKLSNWYDFLQYISNNTLQSI